MTDLPKNIFKAGLMAGEPQTGLWCSIPNPLVLEMLARTGYDWLLLDLEHGPIDEIGVIPLLQAAALGGTHAVVRPSHLDAAEIKKLLDFGAQSILVPYVSTPEEAAAAAAAVAYAPAGIRGMAGSTRANLWGAVEGYARRARDEICLLVQIETEAGLDNLEAIAATPGVDGIFIGPADLAASLGHPGEPSHPEVQARVLDAVARIRAAGLPPGFLTLDPVALREVIDAGSLFTAVAVDMSLLRRGALEAAERWRPA